MKSSLNSTDEDDAVGIRAGSRTEGDTSLSREGAGAAVSTREGNLITADSEENIIIERNSVLASSEVSNEVRGAGTDLVDGEVQGVSTLTEEDRIVTSAKTDKVVATSSVDGVIANAAADEIIFTRSDHRVVTRAAQEVVGEATHRVSTSRNEVASCLLNGYIWTSDGITMH